MSSHPLNRVVVLGASGQFGSRLCRRLVRLDALHLFLGGRDRQKLEATQAQLSALKPEAKLDIIAWKINTSGLTDLLYSRKINLVIHLAGPFQGQDFMVAKACLQAGVPYIDMSDGREFVAKFSSLDAAARKKGVSLITGASTVPGLSSAIVDAKLGDFSQLQGIDYGICAGVKSGLGLATLQGVLSYCGKPYRVLNEGKLVTRFGLGRPRHYDFPIPVNRRYVVDCDIPDHDLFPARYPMLRQMDFGSSIDLPGLPRLLSLMSACVRKGWVKNWNGLSSLIQPFMNAVKFVGSAHSGFFMRLEGRDPHGNPKKMVFEILARDGSGLEIPVTPVILLVKKMLNGESLPAGAYPCIGLFSLAEFQQELSSYPISWETKEVR
jgi:Saccharopine dehydrogenase NADP binding domain